MANRSLLDASPAAPASADSLARVAVTKATNTAWQWRRGCAVRTSVVAAQQHARELVDASGVTPETRSALLPFLEDVERAIGVERDGAA